MENIKITRNDINRMVYESIRRVMLKEEDSVDVEKAMRLADKMKERGMSDEEIDSYLWDKFSLTLEKIKDMSMNDDDEEEEYNDYEFVRDNGYDENEDNYINDNPEGNYTPSEDILNQLKEIGIENEEFESEEELKDLIKERFSYYRRIEPDKEKAELARNIAMSL